MRPASASRRTLAALLLTLAAALGATAAHAVGTRNFQLVTLDDLKGGDLTGVSVDSRGNIRAGLTLGGLPIADASSVWSSVVLADGVALLGTGSEGKIYRARNGQVTMAATTGQMAVSSLAVAWNGEVIAGTFPEGRLYKLPAGGGTGAEAKVFATLPDAEDVWALAFDPRAKALYAATGPEGKLYRIDATGKAQVYFDSDEPHLMSLAVADDGAVYVGSNGRGLLYKVTAPGRAAVVHDFGVDDVRAIAIAPAARGGHVYAIANKYAEAFSPPRKATKAGPPTPQTAKTAKPGKGVLMRFDPKGVGEKMLDDGDTHFVSLALDDEALPYVGTGAEGRVYTVDDGHVTRLVADVDGRQIGAMNLSGKTRFIASTDPVVFHEIKGTGGAGAVWTSKVLDAGMRATFGKLSWRADGVIELEGRTGNTETPDGTWSAWSATLTQPARVQVPAGRFVQLRARFARDPRATLRELSLPFVTDNARAVVTSIESGPKGSAKSAKGLQASGGEAPKPSSSIRLAWKVDNPDQDELRYRLFYRMEGQSQWRSIVRPGEKLTKTDHDWDTTGLPEGSYRILVEASDELANPPERVTKHSLESGTVLVDNTPPVFRAIALQGRRLTGQIVDGLGPIARIEVAVAGSDEWRPLFPTDGIFDDAVESIDADISSIVPAGSHLIAVRVFDAAGNQVTRELEAR